MSDINNQIQTKAKELLESKSVSLVIGFEEGTKGLARPAFITDAAKADKLIYDKRCHHNLAIYFKKAEVKRAGKVAVVAPLFIMKSIIVLASENQVKEENIMVLGVSETNSQNYELLTLDNFDAVEKYINEQKNEYRPQDKALLEKIDAMSPEERWDYWQKELSKCFKCYACRGACPMCYCGTCTVECNQPQWISVPSHDLGNLEWHLMRAMHLAGRCINCGQCADACPLDIPVNILTLKLSEGIDKDFGFKAGTSIKQDYVLSTYKPNDKENFIV